LPFLLKAASGPHAQTCNNGKYCGGPAQGIGPDAGPVRGETASGPTRPAEGGQQGAGIRGESSRQLGFGRPGERCFTFVRKRFRIRTVPGAFNTEYFGTRNLIGGCGLGYHITEDFFAEAVYGNKNRRATMNIGASDSSGRRLPQSEERVGTYYEIVRGGINVFRARLIAGAPTASAVGAVPWIRRIGSTKIIDPAGHLPRARDFGVRVWLPTGAGAAGGHARSTFLALKCLGQNKRATQNLEFRRRGSPFLVLRGLPR